MKKKTKMQEGYGNLTVEDLKLAAEKANVDIEPGFKVVFQYDNYWKIPVFHLMEQIIIFNLFGFKIKEWKKVTKHLLYPGSTSASYKERFCGKYEYAFNATAPKSWIPMILEIRNGEYEEPNSTF